MHFVLTKRHVYEGFHSGQISFPGGKMEKEDANLEQTALRETEEEIGVPREAMQVFGSLTSVYIPPSGYIVHPYVSMLQEEPFLSPIPLRYINYLRLVWISFSTQKAW